MKRSILPTIVNVAASVAVALSSVIYREASAQSAANPPSSAVGQVMESNSIVPDFGSQPGGIFGYERESSLARDLMLGQVARSAGQAGGYGTSSIATDRLALPPMPGEQSTTDSSVKGETFLPGGKLPKISREKTEDFQIRMPTLVGMRQLNNAEPIKKMLLELSTNKVPVLFQTMMMVENGGGSGYAAALNATNGIMQNTMQTHDLQMKFLEITDNSKMQKEAYKNRLKTSFQESGEDAWPAALFGALGDSADSKIGQFNTMASPKAFGVLDLMRGTKRQVGPGPASVKLSELMFFADDVAPESKEYARALQKDFVKYLGDYTMSEQPLDKATAGVTVKIVRQPPETSPSNKRRGLARVKWEEHAVVFEGLGKVLKAYCDFIRNNPNGSSVMFEKKTAELALNELMKQSTFGGSLGYMGMKRSPWEYASGPDIPLSFNLIDQLYRLSSSTVSNAEQLDCKTFDLKADDITTMMGASSTMVKPNLDDCSNNQGCIRNRVLVFLSDMIARSRALHLYRGLMEQSFKFAATPELAEYLSRMFKEEFGDYDINLEISKNRERWEAYQAVLGKYTQSQIGVASSHKPATNNNIASEFTAGQS